MRYTSPADWLLLTELGNIMLALADAARRTTGGDYVAGYMAALSDLATATGTTEWIVGAQYQRDALLQSSPQGRAWKRAPGQPIAVGATTFALPDIADMVAAVLAANEQLAAQIDDPQVQAYRHGFSAAIAAVAVGFGIELQAPNPFRRLEAR